MGKQVTFTAPQIKAFLYSLKRGGVNDENSRRGLINIFLRSVYLWDDRMTLILNGGDRPVSLDDVLLDEIDEHFEGAISGHTACSPLVADAPLYKLKSELFNRDSDFALYAPLNENVSIVQCLLAEKSRPARCSSYANNRCFWETDRFFKSR